MIVQSKRNARAREFPKWRTASGGLRQLSQFRVQRKGRYERYQCYEPFLTVNYDMDPKIFSVYTESKQKFSENEKSPTGFTSISPRGAAWFLQVR